MLVAMTVRTGLKVLFEKAASRCPSNAPAPLFGILTVFKIILAHESSTQIEIGLKFH